jgi:hypothetical protein
LSKPCAWGPKRCASAVPISMVLVAGVAHVLNILREEVARTMTLMGVDRLDDLDESWLLPAQTVVRDEYYSGHMSSAFGARAGG